ncbi:hypothetical protein EV421DRAFT_2038343 [Armillaria borealis]|uniref:Uncharacterized protein n=1 Tax=Armillaria borealis TaxID=47425 RepID=A0AA39MKW9_9AGAR|nr:hypothetical protein EV421DRAFT_2038343 [Armillaria borealis]
MVVRKQELMASQIGTALPLTTSFSYALHLFAPIALRVSLIKGDWLGCHRRSTDDEFTFKSKFSCFPGKPQAACHMPSDKKNITILLSQFTMPFTYLQCDVEYPITSLTLPMSSLKRSQTEVA